MRISGFGRCALSSCVAAVILAGCGGSQPPTGEPGAIPQTSALAAHAERGKSWMAPTTTGQDLLYISSSEGSVFVFAYPEGHLAGTLTGFIGPGGECADSSGDIFIVTFANASYEASTIYEYAHGGTSPIATLSDPGSGVGCAVDPKTGDLAVGNISDASNPYNPYYGDVAVYSGGTGTPKMYYTAQFSSFGFCGYDDQGNLYLSAGSVSLRKLVLARLSSGSGSFQMIYLKQKISSGYRFSPSVQWDGHHMTISSVPHGGGHGNGVATVYRLSISGNKATVFGSVKLNIKRNLHAGQSWIDGSSIVGLYFSKGKPNAAFWAYPKGGEPQQTIKKVGGGVGVEPGGVTISIAPK